MFRNHGFYEHRLLHYSLIGAMIILWSFSVCVGGSWISVMLTCHLSNFMSLKMKKSGGVELERSEPHLRSLLLISACG